MKKLISLMLLFTLCLLFVACAGESEVPQSMPQSDSSTADVQDSGEIDGVRPEFKEAMDSYEAFFTKYCEFMKEMKENPGDLSYLQEYAEYMNQYADTMSKMEALKDGEMSDAEMKYYVDVSGRISKMLIDVTEE